MKINPKHIRLLVPVLFLSMLCGCATTRPISKQLRAAARKDIGFTDVLKDPQNYSGSVVIWGGEIIETENTGAGSSIIILQTPFESGEIPGSTSFSQGRFIARSDKFLDPAIFKPGTRITVGGEITGAETRSIGGVQYTYPVVTIKEMHLWRLMRYNCHPDYWSYRYGWYYPYGYSLGIGRGWR